MSEQCSHRDLMIHVWVEKQLPHWFGDGKLGSWDEDDDAVIREDMGVTCQECQGYDAHYDDWRKAPPGLRAIFALVRENLVKHGYPDPYGDEERREEQC